MTTFLDTNVVVYAFDVADPEKQARAQAVLHDTDPATLVISSQVLSEFFVVVTRKLATPLAQADAAAAVRSLSAFQVVAVDSTLVQEAITQQEAHQLHYWDALIVSAASRAGCDRLLSEDLQDCQRIGSLEVSNPFS